ncbi:MAG: hypothetical protein JWN20_2440 [Jatrophihabitantaceae bacterium]|nr:hypothetical protein [Jatrophihabitantaceae bacterium]
MSSSTNRPTSSSYSNEPSRGSASASKKERTLSLVAGVLGVLMFLLGFLKWLKVGDGDDAQKYGGFAFGTPTSAVILLSLAAGLIAALGAMDHRDGRGVPSAIPTGLAAASLLGAIAILLNKGSISDGVGDQVAVEIGLILGIIVAAIQTVVLAMGLASRKDDEANTGYGTTATPRGSTP